jgi:hypothetical protein
VTTESNSCVLRTYTRATRNNTESERNSPRNADATHGRPLPMTGSALRAQLRMQQARNNAVAQGAQKAPEVAHKVAAVASGVAVVAAAPEQSAAAQQPAQQQMLDTSTVTYEETSVARCRHRVFNSATPDPLAARAVVSYQLADGSGGLLIDPAGPASAVCELHWRFGERLDWRDLLATFEARERLADRKAAALIRRLMAGGRR